MPTAPRPSDSRRLYQQVADRIRAVIQEQGFAVGSRLPPERELALQLGISRPSLREALIALEIDGWVEIRGGSGVYVCVPPATQDDSTPSLGESPSELMRARAALEGTVIALAAARASPAGLQAVADALEAMRQEHAQGRVPLEADRRFHLSIAEMSGNSVLVRLVSELFDDRHSPISTRISVRTESAQSWVSALSEHEAIYRALEARDPQAATAAMVSHLRNAQERWTGGPTITEEAPPAVKAKA